MGSVTHVEPETTLLSGIPPVTQPLPHYTNLKIFLETPLYCMLTGIFEISTVIKKANDGIGLSDTEVTQCRLW